MARRHGLPHAGLDVLPGGSVEHTVRVGAGAEQWVVQFHRDPRRAGTFEAAAWCAQQAREAGVPTARYLTVGELDGVGYAIQEHVTGAPAAPHGEVWRQLGSWSARIGRIPLDGAPDAVFSRFGRDTAAAWLAHLAYHRRRLGATDPLVALGVYGRRQVAALDRLCEGLLPLAAVTGLVHGDLFPRNVLLGGEGPVLVDWGTATTGPVPGTDLARVLDERRQADGPTDEDVALFVDGAGGVVDVRSASALRVLRDLDLVRWALDRRPDLVAERAAVARRTVRSAADLLGS